MSSPRDSTLAVLDQAHGRFGTTLDRVSVSDWASPTPCDEWDVGQLVDHVAHAALIYAALLGGRSFDEAMGVEPPPPASAAGPTPYLDAVAALRDALARPGGMATECDVPGGPITGGDLAAVRIFDVTVHCWDLARAIGAPERLPDAMVDRALRYAITDYGDEAAAAAEANARQRDDLPRNLLALLLLSGRAP